MALMAPLKPALAFSAVNLLAHLIPAVIASGGTQIPISLYTDIQCQTPSTETPNASLALSVCAVTPGLGSLVLHPYPCTSGTVKVWAFSDTACGTQDDIFDLGSDCAGRANPGAYAAIMLSCNQEEPGSPQGTTTIDVGPVATAGGAATSAASTAGGALTSPTSPASPPSSSSPPTSWSGWNSFPIGAKIGIPIAAVVVLAVLIWLAKFVISACLRRRYRRRWHPPPSQPPAWTPNNWTPNNWTPNNWTPNDWTPKDPPAPAEMPWQGVTVTSEPATEEPLRQQGNLPPTGTNAASRQQGNLPPTGPDAASRQQGDLPLTGASAASRRPEMRGGRQEG